VRPTVDIVIPVFNRADAVCRAIASVLAQTHQAFDIVVVDDASTDRTAAAVAAIGDPRITLIRHKRNRGGGAARNTGIRVSAAPYVAFLDSDDEWLPEKLERQLEVFDGADERLALVYSGAERIYPESTVVHMPAGHADLVRALLTDNVIGESSLGMVRREALQAVGGFDESLSAAQDLDLWLRLCERYDAAFVPAVLARVMKPNDRGRISFAGGAAGREQFRTKHREKMRRHGVLHLHLRESGWWTLREMRDSRRARQLYLEALAAKPWAPGTYGLLAAACLPDSWLDGLATWAHYLAPGSSAQARQHNPTTSL
jgi:glycosyltransferase involved in cell wall biosynthesis